MKTSNNIIHVTSRKIQFKLFCTYINFIFGHWGPYYTTILVACSFSYSSLVIVHIIQWESTNTLLCIFSVQITDTNCYETKIFNKIPYAGNIWRGKILVNTHFLNFWTVKYWRTHFCKLYLDCKTRHLEGKNLVNCHELTKFANIFPLQIFPTYSIHMKKCLCGNTAL